MDKTVAKKSDAEEVRLRLYRPHEMQLRFHNSNARFLVASWGRQSGKSTAALNDAVFFAWTNPGIKIWFLSPTYDQAKVQYRRLVGMLWPCNEIMLKKNQTELRIKLINQSEIIFKSGETLDNLRGSTINRAYIDEVRDQHRDLWPMVIRPMLATTKGSCRFISTPNGFDQFYDLFKHAEEDQTGLWETLQAPSTCNPLITQEELNDAKRTMSQSQFEQEYLAEFRDLTSGRAYVNFHSGNLRSDCPFYPGHTLHPALPIIVAMDFNLNPMCWTLGQKKIEKFHWFDEIHLKNSHTQEAAEFLCNKLKEHEPREDYLKKTGVIICGDATANAGQRAAAGQSDYDIIFQTLDRHGIRWQNMTPESNPGVKDRVNTMNASLKSATGEVNTTLDPISCPNLKKDFERVVWKISNSDHVALDQKTNPELTHQSDGVGYSTCALSPLVYDSSVPSMRIIQR